MPDIRQLEDDIIDILKDESRDSDLFDIYREEVAEDNYTNREFDSLLKFVNDGLEFYLELKPRARPDDVIYQLIRMKAGDYVLADRKLEDELSDRDYREAKAARDEADIFLEAMEKDRGGRGRSRGRGRDDREDRGRSGGDRSFDRGGRSSSRSSSRSTGGRSSRREEPVDRSARRQSRGRGADTQFEARRQEKQSTPVIVGEGNQLAALRAQLSSRPVEEPQAPAAPVNDGRAPRGFERASRQEMPNPEEVNTVAERRPAVEMKYQDTPQHAPEESDVVRTRQQWLDDGFDVEDEAFILDLPVRPYSFENPTHLPFFYEPDSKRPKWRCAADGYRELTFREVDMNYDDAMIPDFGRPAALDKGVKTAVALLKGTAASYRYQPLDVAADIENQKAQHQKDVEAWEQENEGKPDEEKSPKPLLVLEGIEVNHATITHPGTVTSFSLNETRVKVATTLAELGTDGAASTNIEVDARELELVYQVSDEAEYLELIDGLRLFSQSAVSETTSYKAYHDRLLALRGQIPAALWIAINKRLTAVVNDCLRGNMAIPASIDDFSADGLTFIAELDKEFGRTTIERFDRYGREMMRQFHFVTFKPSDLEGLPPRCVYFMERQHLVFMPFSAPELGVMSPVGYSDVPSRAARVTRAASPMLHKALLGFTNQETATDAHFGITRKLVLADGTVLDVFRSWYDINESEYLVRIAK